MPALSFRVTGVEPASRGLVPLLHFQIEVTNFPGTELIQAILLHAQIQIQSPQRYYDAEETEKLVELFGTSDRWGQTLRSRLWTHANATVRPFTRNTNAILPVQCTYDFNVSATKYFYALKEGNVLLLFLFSGTVFYDGPDGRLQVEQIAWDNECTYQLPLPIWQQLMDRHYPNSAWVNPRRRVFEKLYAYKRRHGLQTWEQTIERLLTDIESVNR
jgi:Family of unknown function (DUF6084)